MMPDVFEPLGDTAPLAYAFAAANCGEECRQYHGTWQYLRLLGMNVTIRADRPFFIDTFRQLARQGARRILISGSADYGMLAQVVFAFRAEGIESDVVLVDRCGTPLEANLDYAKRIGARLNVELGDVRGLSVEPVDVICTHSFFTYFPHAARDDLTRAWHGLLRPGGCVVMSNPIMPPEPVADGRRSPEQVEAYRRDVLAAARAFEGVLPMTPESLADDAAAIRATRESHATSSLDELRAPFDAAGFALAHLDRGVDTTTHAGPFNPKGASIFRGQVIARRPA